MTTKTDEKAFKLKIADVKPGHMVSMTFYCQVNSIGFNSLETTDLINNRPLRIKGLDLIQSLQSADYFDEVIHASKTSIKDELDKAGSDVFTICFNKKDGSERVMRGKLLDAATDEGFSAAWDLDKPAEDRWRLINRREINWLILRGKKYVRK